MAYEFTVTADDVVLIDKLVNWFGGDRAAIAQRAFDYGLELLESEMQADSVDEDDPAGPSGDLHDDCPF